MRLDFQRIAAFIPRRAAVLDLGCGGGDMLAHLRRTRDVRGVGVDIDGDNLVRCLKNNVQAIHCDISRGLAMFGTDTFDVVVLSDTLQNVHMPPQKLLHEMLRIGRAAIVSFPNFGYWPMRLQLLAGKTPSSRTLPHRWYNTPNIRYCTVRDFEALCGGENMVINRRVFLCGSREIMHAANLLAETAIYHLRRAPTK